jgi:hypothetical protein
MNFFALGFNLRTAFAGLMNAVYVNCYPHLPKNLLRNLHILNPSGNTGANIRNNMMMIGTNSPLKTLDEMLQKFEFKGYSHVIHASSDLSLSEDGQTLLIGSPGSDEAPGDAFVHSTCCSKF